MFTTFENYIEMQSKNLLCLKMGLVSGIAHRARCRRQVKTTYRIGPSRHKCATADANQVGQDGLVVMFHSYFVLIVSVSPFNVEHRLSQRAMQKDRHYNTLSPFMRRCRTQEILQIQ